MFRDVPECSRMFRDVPCSGFYRRPNKFPFSQAKGVISKARVGWFSRALTCFARSNIHLKNYSAIARRKNIPFYPARTDINFSYFQLARRSLRFPSQLTSQWFFFQLAQILPEERGFFFRAAPSGTPVFWERENENSNSPCSFNPAMYASRVDVIWRY